MAVLLRTTEHSKPGVRAIQLRRFSADHAADAHDLNLHHSGVPSQPQYNILHCRHSDHDVRTVPNHVQWNLVLLNGLRQNFKRIVLLHNLNNYQYARDLHRHASKQDEPADERKPELTGQDARGPRCPIASRYESLVRQPACHPTAQVDSNERFKRNGDITKRW